MRKSAVYFARLSECLIAFRPNWGHRPRRQRTAAVYLKAAGIPLRSPGGWGRHGPKPAIEVITDPVEVAQQIWSAVHGAVALELKGLVLTADPQRTYEAFLVTVIRGLAPG